MAMRCAILPSALSARHGWVSALSIAELVSTRRTTMLRALKLAHIVGLVIFLGSILTFIVISALIENSSLENIAFGRRIISTGTSVLTLPGLWLIAVTGLCRGYLLYGWKNRFSQIKLLLVTLIILNAYLFIVPAATSA